MEQLELNQQQQSIQALADAQSKAQEEMVQQSVGMMLDKLQPVISMLVTIAAIMAAVTVLLMLFNAFYKWRVSRAILRIDKNLEALIASQTPAPAAVQAPAPQAPVQQQRPQPMPAGPPPVPMAAPLPVQQQSPAPMQQSDPYSSPY